MKHFLWALQGTPEKYNLSWYNGERLATRQILCLIAVTVFAKSDDCNQTIYLSYVL